MKKKEKEAMCISIPFFAGRCINKRPIFISLIVSFSTSFIFFVFSKSVVPSILGFIILFLFIFLVYYPSYLNYFYNFWKLNNKGIKVTNTTNYNSCLERFLWGVFKNEESHFCSYILYEEIQSIKVIYNNKSIDMNKKFSFIPGVFDVYIPFLRKSLYISVKTKNNKEVKLDLYLDYLKNNKNAYLCLSDICEFFKTKRIMIRDNLYIEGIPKEQSKIYSEMYNHF